METMTTFKLDIQSQEPNFDDFKDQLKAYLAASYNVDFTSDELCHATVGAVYHDWQIKELSNLIFGQSEELFTDIIKDVRFVGNGICTKCGGSTLADLGDKHYYFRKEPEPGEYKCLYCDTKIEIK
jgi:hypothetical protein